MDNLRKIIGLLVLLTVVIGCERQARTKVEPKVVLLLLKTSDNPFFRSIETGAREALKSNAPDLTLAVRAGANEGDVTSQKRILEEFYQRYVAGRTTPILAGVLLTPSGSSSELTTEIARFNEKNVPVILVDTKIDEVALQRAGARYMSYIGSDNRQGGALAAQLMVEQLPSGGRLLLFNGVQGHETAAQRREGFLEVINNVNSKGARRFVIEERTANWRRSEARSTTDAILSLGRDLDGVFAANDEMALGVLEALRQHSRAKRPHVIIGFDAIDEAVKAVNEGSLTATVAQRPSEMGRRAVLTLIEIQKRAQVQRDQVVPVEVVRRPAQ